MSIVTDLRIFSLHLSDKHYKNESTNTTQYQKHFMSPLSKAEIAIMVCLTHLLKNYIFVYIKKGIIGTWIYSIMRCYLKFFGHLKNLKVLAHTMLQVNWRTSRDVKF